ncbi:GLPGLI family protein [Pedobacter sp. L105]|uniref:GLPGLI family protein n=1 Tax=Pedobacter sp. L105 TaxID=1641871 RepID=UPI00131B6244|nr:GLPGLI family protein [Pedobacter sp. L105]
MKKLTLLTCLFTSLSSLLFAQNTRFVTEGEIEYEKSVNSYAIIEKKITNENTAFYTPALEQFKKTQPQFKLAKSTLFFSKNKTLFKPEEDNSAENFLSNEPIVNQINTIYTDVDSHQQTTQKKVFEETFLIKDSTRVINWKITNETREIAGYSCRRANALILDSIYVVAFYADQIPVSGGPESFTGLPGMILGLALPHENISWFAKSVKDKTMDKVVIAPPTKGKAVNDITFMATLKSALKQWGEYAKSYLKAFQI